MNNNYYQNPMFPQEPIGTELEQFNTPNQETAPNISNQSTSSGLTYVQLQGPYNENIFRANTGRIASFYMSFSDSVEWRDKVFTGVIEEAGKDHVIISDPKTGKWTLLVLLYLDYVEFEEPINYPVIKSQR